ncbi:response regulator [Winogradskyella bathintestinalis]|uniref:histidine kinase n=1 Tax=Winogradskyella bathintestinalis TaxID=3035208 RepID=A0ABT7ZWQ9_9FLAO|nr:response regulator [Winogradskyella bathintestinalis]MDN3493446.1 response regulator [Winogradskyella bathintestinalis]
MKLYNTILFILVSFVSIAQTDVTFIDNNESINFTYLKQELSNQWVSSVIQDNEGFMWFATQNGLYKYNGYEFLTYRFNPYDDNSIPANWVRKIIQDKNGIFWLGTQGEGLVKFDQRKNTFEKIRYNTAKDIQNSIVFSTFSTTKNNIWVVGDDGLFRKSHNANNFVRIREKFEKVFLNETNNGTEIVVLNDTIYQYNNKNKSLDVVVKNIALSRLAVTTNNTLIYRNEGKIYSKKLHKAPEQINIQDFIILISNVQNDKIILIGKKHIYKYDFTKNSIEKLSYNLKNSAFLNNVNSIYLDSQDITWIATRNGVYKENKAGNVFSNNINLHARRIIDDGKTLYIGGINGLHYFSKIKDNYETIIKEKPIFSVLKTEKGIWAGDMYGTLYFVDKFKNIKSFNLNKNGEGLLKLYGLVQDKNGFIWVSSWHGLYVINDKGTVKNFFEFTNTNSKELKAIQLHIDKSDNLWVLTVGNGLFIVPNISEISTGKSDFKYRQYTHKKGNVNTLNSNVLYEIHEDNTGDIWIGSDFGINKYILASDNFEALKIENTYFDKKVMAIQTDDDKSLWISTLSSGIIVYNTKNKKLINLRESDGLISDACLFTSSAFNGKELYFGTEQGIQIINPKNIINPTINKAPVITQIKILGEHPFQSHSSILNDQSIYLNHKQSDLNIDFALQDFRFPEKINYYYLLENGHSDWRKAKNNTVTYTNLKPGKYQFKVKASYKSESETPIAYLSLIISSPWYATTLAYIIYITIIIAILTTFLYLTYHQKLAVNKLNLAKELNQLKSNFFTNISHEFRTPLTLISSPIDDTLSDDSISENKRQKFIVAKQNSERLLELVDQLLDLSKIDEGHLKLQIQQGNVLQLISAIGESFSYLAGQKNITYTFDIDLSEKNVWFDKDAVEKIIINLLSNAFKYTPINGTIFCRAYIENNQLLFKITNSGKGLTAFELDNIFERFYQTNEQNQGSGIGLALVKELVVFHKGKIEANSIPNKVTSFNLNLSIDKNSFKNNAVIVNTQTEVINKVPNFLNPIIEDSEEYKDSDLPILLIVEDNADLRHLLKQTFKKNYNILTAPNGKIGVQLALEHIPDLIISDIMMPEKDGVTLTENLKNDERSAHIPIILLTAKTELESKFIGINIGADDYITKPFDKQLLILKVEKLIESRRKLQLRYSQELALLPKDIAITNLDEIFLEKVQEALDNSIVDPAFNVTEFSEAVGMSRMQLHRKLKALTGLTASEFIRSQRLKLASRLLKNSDINISQVGYSVGFNDHSYFTKCFKETYNCTPTEFAKRK